MTVRYYKKRFPSEGRQAKLQSVGYSNPPKVCTLTVEMEGNGLYLTFNKEEVEWILKSMQSYYNEYLIKP